MADANPLPSKDELQRLFILNAETGVLIRKWRDDIPNKINKRCAGKEAGYKSKRGYVQVGIGFTLFLAHRIVWKMVHDEEHAELDHINGDGSDNRPANLRPATRSQNLSNRGGKVGRDLPKGVRRNPFGSFLAQIQDNGRTIHLGTFKTIDEARAAYWSAATERHGEFARSE